MSRTYSARVMRFRRGVYGKRDGLTSGCRVLLLRLSDDMNAKAIVSIPRSKLADELDVAPARITEWIAQARSLGFLDVVRRARPGVTAVYQGLVVAPEVREGVPLQRYAKPDLTEVREGVPPEKPQRYARAVPQVVSAERNVPPVPDSPPIAATRSETCAVCADFGCPRCTPDESETEHAAS